MFGIRVAAAYHTRRELKMPAVFFRAVPILEGSGVQDRVCCDADEGDDWRWRRREE